MPARPLVLLWVRSVIHFIEIQAPAFEGYDFPPNTAPEFFSPRPLLIKEKGSPSYFKGEYREAGRGFSPLHFVL